MRVRMGVLAVALAVALSACTDDDDPESTPTDAPLTEITISCPEFEDTAKKITDAQTALYTGAGGSEAIDDLVTELDALKEGAPSDIQTALTDLGAGFRDAAELLEDPTRKNRAELADLAPKLAEDGQRVTEYITSQCD